jgi:hypothetical protein
MEPLPYTREDIGLEFEITGRRLRLAGLEEVNERGETLIGPDQPAVGVRATFVDRDGGAHTVDFALPPGYDTEASL